ncbi:MAG: NUDIX hydrolase [Rhodospirillaceae bacterium]|nr:NUDIX hydrolase [Rhodospirillaceae bacterium]
MRQKVLSIENKYISSLIAQRAFHSDENTVRNVGERIKSFSKFVDRQWAENHSSVKQIVACGIVTNHEKILCLRRSRKSNRVELRLNWTLMVGGHVDEEDMDSVDPILNCVIREVEEETGLEPQFTPQLLGYVTDPATPAGRLHIGAVFKFESAQDSVQFSSKLDNEEFVNARKKKTIKFREARFVVDLANRSQLDPWSEIFVQSRGRKRDKIVPSFSGLQLEFSFNGSNADTC